jgi:hypothetical protein
MNDACPKEAARAHGKHYSLSPIFALLQCDPRQTRHRNRLLAEDGDEQTHFFELGHVISISSKVQLWSATLRRHSPSCRGYAYTAMTGTHATQPSTFETS